MGPSGVGKTTLLAEYISGQNALFEFSVSYATREKRANEVHGKHYFFVSEQEFLKMKDEGKFIEWFKVHDSYKGTAKHVVDDIIKKGKIPVFDVDIQGAKKIYDVYPEANFLCVLPPSYDKLEARLQKRGTETPESLAIRMKTAKVELNGILEHPEIFQYRVVNDDLQKAKKTFDCLLQTLYAKEMGKKVPQHVVE